MTIINQDLLLTLKLIKGIGNKTIIQILKTIKYKPVGYKELLDVLEEASNANKRIKVPPLKDIEDSYNKAIEIIESAQRNRIEILSITDTQYPQDLKLIENPPIFIFAKGNIDAINSKVSLAIVGTRTPTNYGAKSAKRFGEICAEKNITVVSGLALGCDTQAHIGCLAHKGITIAVLGHGLDTITPKSNEKLAEEILKNRGCIISEYPIGESVRNYNLAQRNRIISGLSKGILVVETKEKGGTMHTANYALKQKKLLACLNHPQKFENENIIDGNQRLIKTNKAKLISDLQDLNNFLNMLQSNDKTIIKDVANQQDLFNLM